jgi:putative DNA primase/helicase
MSSAAIQIAEDTLPLEPLQRTQLANAERYMRSEYAKDTLFCEKTRQWYVWNGHRWVEDDMRVVRRNMTAVVYAIRLEALAITDQQQSVKMLSWAFASESNANVVGALEHLKSFVVVSRDQFDTNHWLLNFTNGTLDLVTDDFRAPFRGDYITKAVPYDYVEPSINDMGEVVGECPLWEKFLSEIFPGRYAEIIPYLQRCIGYSLTGDTREQCLWLLMGGGANGKGVFVHTLQRMLGEYAKNASWESFAVKRSGSSQIPEDLARLAGARFVAASEGDKSVRMNEAVVKNLTGSDIITARFLNKNSFEFTPEFKLWLASNHKPKLIGHDDGIWRRLRYIPFTVSFKGREDRKLEKKLEAELPGILNWARVGLKDYLANGIQTPEIVLKYTEDFRAESDQLSHFLGAHTEVGKHILQAELYKKYKEWCEVTGETYTMSSRDMKSAMLDRGMDEKPTNKGLVWVGIQFVEHQSVQRLASQERAEAERVDATEDQGEIEF